MLKTILRKEHKNQWEKRTPLTPQAVENLISDGLTVDFEYSDVRIFNDSTYQNHNAIGFNTPDNHQLVIGIKEPPVDSIQQEQVHLCFSHTIKGQDYNMPLLQQFIDKQATLLDYELMVDDAGFRTIAFGEYAGIAGAVDSLWIAGEKLKQIDKASGLSSVKQTIHYKTIDTVKQSLAEINMQEGAPIRVLIIGTGNVSRGAEQVCQWLGLPKLEGDDFLANNLPEGSWYVVAGIEHLHQRLSDGGFDLDEYFEKGKSAYKSILDSLLGRFDILLQCSFWTDFYPRHLGNAQIIDAGDKMPWVVGDISCDINGSFICTQKASTIEHPAFSYDANTGVMTDGIDWSGTTVMSIDNLPCELSLDASIHFSNKLEQYTPHLMKMDLQQSFEQLELFDELKCAVIVYKGKLTEKFQYLSDSL